MRRSEIAAAQALRALLSLMDDCAALQEMLLQWIAKSPMAGRIDSELGTLDDDLPGAAPLLSYVRYNVHLQSAAIRDLLGHGSEKLDLEDLTAMDAPENMPTLHRLGIAAGQRKVQSEHFPAVFDLT